MKTKLLLSLLVVAAFFAGSLVSRTSAVDDEFSSTILAHGVEFNHTDTFAQAQPNVIAPRSQFLPGSINLYGDVAGFSVNGYSVIVAPERLIEIPEANGTNNTEVLNDIRAVLIESGLAVAPQ